MYFQTVIYKHQTVNWHSGHRFIGLLFVFAGLISLGGNLLFTVEDSEGRSFWIGIAFTLVGIITASGNTGVLLDLSKKRYKHYTTILGIKWGDWQQLPEIDHIYIGSITEESTNLPNGISPTLSGKTTAHFVLLMTDEKEALLSFQYSKIQKATDTAKLLSNGLNAPQKG